MTAPDDVAQLRKDHTSLASSISVLTTEVGDLKLQRAIDKAVGTEREKTLAEREENLDKRLDRIEASVAGLHGIGKWLLLAFFGALIAAIVSFMVKGGFVVPPTP